jgi:hypothetical protein
MSNRTKQVIGIFIFFLSIMASLLTGLWWSFMMADGGLMPISPNTVDYTILLVLLLVTVGLIKFSYFLYKPTKKNAVKVTLYSIILISLFFIWLNTPLSSCKYFPPPFISENCKDYYL